MHYFVSFLALKTPSRGRERAGCFGFIVSRMSCYCQCSVALPQGPMGWSAVCDSSISCSYPLTIIEGEVGTCTL